MHINIEYSNTKVMFHDDQDNVVFSFHTTARPITNSRRIRLVKKKKVKSAYEPKWPISRSLSRFLTTRKRVDNESFL